MILDDYVEVKWGISNRQHLINKGYLYTKLKDTLNVAVLDLPRGSNTKINASCDLCGKIRNGIPYWEYNKICNTNSGEYLCRNCTKFINLTGTRKGSLTILHPVNGFNGTKTKWLCLCDCGAYKEIKHAYLVANNKNTPKSCGGPIHRVRQNLTGQRFGKLLVIEEHHRNNNGIFWLCLCDCGTTKVVRSGTLVRGDTKSCGCSVAFKRRGKEHHAYNHAISEEERLLKSKHRMYFEYMEWRKNVFKRDQFKCQCCNKRGKSATLHAHHIYGYAKYPKLRLSINNGATLCACCHEEFHTTYGYRKFTPENFYEFLEIKKQQLAA